MAEAQSYPQAESGQYQSNQGYNTANILAIRLDVSEPLERLESYLKGEIRIQDVKDGAPIIRVIKSGKPLVNSWGVQALMSSMTSVLNSAVVQGNIKPEFWMKKIGHFRRETVKMLVANTENWEISDYDLEPINNFMCHIHTNFSSRLIDNKERESYSSYTQSQVTQVRAAGGGFLGGLFGGGKPQ